MELIDIVNRFRDSIKEIDDRIEHGRGASTGNWGKYLGGIGSGHEIDIRDELCSSWNSTYSSDSIMKGEVSYPEGDISGRCDICISEKSNGIRETDIHDWGIELKMVRNIGDNGGVNNYGLGKVVSPFKSERSSVHDCRKLRDSRISNRKAIVIFGFEFDSESVGYCKEWEERNRHMIPDHQLNIDEFPPRWKRMQAVLEKNTYKNEWGWEEIIPIFESSCKSMGINLNTPPVNVPLSGLTRHPIYRKIRFLGWELC